MWMSWCGICADSRTENALIEPVILKEYNIGQTCSALLARHETRWLLAVSIRQPNGNVGTTIFGINEAKVNKDAKELGMTPARVAEYEADGMMKQRGWEP